MKEELEFYINENGIACVPLKMYNDALEEIQRLNNNKKEVREYIESYMPNYDFDKTNLIKLLEILDKGE